MVGKVNAVQETARKAIEATYSATLTVTEIQKVKDEKSKLTKSVEVITLQDEPCRLSFEKIQAVVQSESAAAVVQGVKIFVSPDISIKAGSKLTVTQDSVTRDYTQSGTPAVYPTHQEIMVELFRRYA